MEIKEEEPEDELLLVLTEDGGVKNEEDPVADRLENRTDPLLTRWVGYIYRLKNNYRRKMFFFFQLQNAT